MNKRNKKNKKNPIFEGSERQSLLLEKKAESFELDGLDCPDCALKIEKAVRQLPGVSQAQVDFLQTTLKLEVDETQFNPAALEKTIKKLGYSLAKAPAASSTSLRLIVEGLDCAEEINLIKKALAHQPGIKELKFFLVTREVEVYFDPEKIQEKEIIARINKLGLKAEPVEDIGNRNRRLLVLTAIAGGLTLLGIFLSWLGIKEEIRLAIYLLAILIGGTHIARKGLAAARHLSLDMNFLMTIAVIGAAFIGEWVEAAVVVFLFSLAQLPAGHPFFDGPGP